MVLGSMYVSPLLDAMAKVARGGYKSEDEAAKVVMGR